MLKTLRTIRAKLSDKIDAFRKDQSKYMTGVLEDFSEPISNQNTVMFPEKHVLHLPSDFTAKERVQHKLVAMGEEEIKLREGEAHDAILALRTEVKAINTARYHKRWNIRGQGPNTISNSVIENLKDSRDAQMENYNAARGAMIRLGSFDSTAEDSPYPYLSYNDLYCKTSEARRAFGDSHRTDGRVMALPAARPIGTEISNPKGVLQAAMHGEAGDDNMWEDVLDDEIDAGTRMHPHRKQRLLKTRKEFNKDTSHVRNNSPEREDGWVFTTRKTKDMSAKAIEEWEAEGKYLNRVLERNSLFYLR